MIRPFKKFIEAFQLIMKIFLGVDFEKSLKYTLEKNSLKLFDCFERFPGCII